VVAFRLLEPLQARLRRPLQRLDLGSALGLVGRQRPADVAMVPEPAAERDGVLHGQLGAGADREVRGVGGVADEDDVVVVPALVADDREAPPQRAVLQDGMSVELAREQRLRERHRVVLAGLVEPGAPPRVLGGFQDEGRVARLVAVGVDAPQPVLVLLEDEREGGERERGAEPHEAVAAPVDLRPEVAGVALAHPGVHAVGGHHQVGALPGGGAIDLGREPREHAELRRP